MVVETPGFDIAAPLPTGTTVLEASAGTGKTWTIVALVTRLLAEQEVRISELLIMTFTRIATGELRSRVREGISRVATTLSGLIGGTISPTQIDDLEFFHATGTSRKDAPTAPLLEPEEIGVKVDRLRRALVEFDDATIATIHEFCSFALQALGTVHGPATFELLENPEELHREVIEDVYLRTFMGETEPTLAFKDAEMLAAEALKRPSVAIHPPLSADLEADVTARIEFIAAVRKEFTERKRDLGVKTYDDLLSSLAQIVDPDDGVDETAQAARQALRSRWSHVLVDEFQDTDDTQWRIFKAVFHSAAVLTLIGDPKQAIYGFRGGDINTYLAATRHAAHKATLGYNYRADAELIECLNGFFQDAELGHPQITVEPVKPGKTTGTVEFNGGEQPRLRVRVLNPEGFVLNRNHVPSVGDVRRAIGEDLVAEIRTLLASGHRIRVTEGTSTTWRNVEARDIAILCHVNADATRYHSVLRDAGIHAVINRGANVFTSQAAVDWLTLLEAIERPRDVGLVKAAALSPFFGNTARRLLEDPESVIDEVSTLLRRYNHSLVSGGPAALYEKLKDAGQEGLVIRVLRHPDGERRLTDLQHVAELLHAEFPRGAPAAMAAWLRTQRRDAAQTEYERRLESDDSAVQIYTIHMAKGLEFPFVYVPSTATQSETVNAPYLADLDGVRVLNVDPDPKRHGPIKAAAQQEDRGERERNIYVALTRAVAQVTTYVAPITGMKGRAWYRLLQRKGADFGHRTPFTDVMAQLQRDWGEHAAIEEIVARDVPPVRAPSQERPGPAREWSRVIDPAWRRSSYTSLSAAGESFPEAGFKETPGELTATTSAEQASRVVAAAEVLHVPSPMAMLPRGARFGSLVHAVLEHIDFRSVSDEQITKVVQEHLQYWPQELDPSMLARAIRAVISTPLQPALGVSLEGLDPAQRLDELEFEMPLDGGQWAPNGARVTVRDIAPLLRTHLKPSDPLYRYADAIDTPAFAAQSLRGYLTGSIDLVFRAEGRFYVADYKTNWLGPAPGARATPEVNTTATYDAKHVAEAMEGSSYPLQALIYIVALHRYLTWRLPGYNPVEHIGGVLYLYVRGMAGPQTPVIDGHATGVFFWQPPAALIAAISELFDGAGGVQ